MGYENDYEENEHEHRPAPRSYKQKSSSVFSRIWGQLDLFGFTERQIKAASKDIYSAMDKEFQGGDYDFIESYERFEKTLREELGLYKMSDKEIDKTVKAAMDQVAYCFDPNHHNR